MRKLTATLCLTIAVLLGSMGMSASADFRNREQEYKNKNYDTAARLCRPFAEQGHTGAQSNLGWTYSKGRGVPKNE